MSPKPSSRLTTIKQVGSRLVRPSGLLALDDGGLLVTDNRGGVTHIQADGRQGFHLAQQANEGAFRPSTLGLMADGTFVLGNASAKGGIWQLDKDRSLTLLHDTVEGLPIPSVSALMVDRKDRIWATIATFCEPIELGFRADVADGALICIEDGQPRLVADGLCFPSGLALSADENSVLLTEMFGRRLMSVDVTGAKNEVRQIAGFGPGDFPSGVAIDEAGGIWVVSNLTNRLYRISPDGRKRLLLQDVSKASLQSLEQQFEKGQITRQTFAEDYGSRLGSLTSLAFGGKDRKTLYFGSLHASAIAYLRCPIAGLAPSHWQRAPAD
ncbi:SMP-30/gluconolactonase/LRE family protein [Rhodovibrionaceae bacterium A322]